MLKSAYCSVAEADELNNSDAWNVLIESEKQKALDWGRVYLDQSYSCASGFDTLDATNDADEISAYKAANAVLGDKYANGELFQASGTQNKAITEKAVKAGSVSTRTKYSDASTGETFDPFPEVSALLSDYCFRNSSTISMRPLIRA